MKKACLILFLLPASQLVFAQNEIGPEGHKLLWILPVVLLVTVAFVVSSKPLRKGSSKTGKSFLSHKRIKVKLEKDALYYPDKLTLTVKNSGSTDIDLDQPLLVFDNFWLKRKFKIKGMDNHKFYPLYLEKGKTHSLEIDLNRFYQHDKKLKKFPKAKVFLSDVKGKKLGRTSIFLRKTLFKF